MLRRFAFLLVLFALFGAAGTAVSAASLESSPCAEMAMTPADCMKMMAAPDAEKSSPEKHKGCTPGDCLKFMLACSGISAVPANEAPLAAIAFSERADFPLQLVASLAGVSPPPPYDPPIA